MATDPYAPYKRSINYDEHQEPVYNPYSFTSEQHPNNSYDTSYTGYRDDAFVPPAAAAPVVPEKPVSYPDTRGSSYITGPPRESVLDWGLLPGCCALMYVISPLANRVLQ